MLSHRKVYIANKGAHDFRPAEKFGDLIFITEGEINKFAIGDLYRTFIKKMEGSSENDFFLPTSLPILSSIGSGILAHRYGIVHLLLFRTGNYVVRTIDFSERDYGGQQQGKQA